MSEHDAGAPVSRNIEEPRACHFTFKHEASSPPRFVRRKSDLVPAGEWPRLPVGQHSRMAPVELGPS